MIITANSVTFHGDQALAFARLQRAMRQLGRGLVMHPGGSYEAADGQPLPTEPQIAAAIAAADAARVRSQMKPVTARQLRLWLHGAGLLDEIPALIEAMPEPQKTTAQIEWEFSTQYERTHPLVIQLGTALGMTSADLDLAWRHASRL
jgi:hypothetical protein